jgi:hypothetical protein
MYEHPSHKMSKSFREILNAFDISNEVIDTELARNFLNKNESGNEQSIKSASSPQSYPIVEVAFPNNTFKINEFPDDYLWKQVALEYLKSRCIDPQSYPFHLSIDKDFENRLIIPYYRNSKLIYWQGRLFDDTEKKRRYINPTVDKANILFNYDKVFEYTDKPVIITEGVFDAIAIDGVAIAGSDLSQFHTTTFNRTKREKVFVIDKDIKGYKLGKKVLELGYNITWLDGHISDINDGIIKMGKLWTVQNILQNISSGLYAKLWLENMIKGVK